MSLETIEEEFLSELENQIAENTISDIWATIHEIAGSHIPIWYFDLISLARRNLWLVIDEPELPPKNAIQAIAENLYDHLVELGFAKENELKGH